ncbi:MAG TPA: serine hydrolase [Pyrinomonadaceae bacterium]|jgi:CubicO group peptidase (beta-lactamase class C family)/ketosteroid isomerase-like protein
MNRLSIVGLLFSIWLVPSAAVSRQFDVQKKANEIAASFNRQKQKVKEKSGVKEDYYRRVRGESAVKQNVIDYSGMYEMPGLDFTIDLQVGNDGKAEATGFDSSTGSKSAARRTRPFRLENAKVESGLLTGTKIYEDGRAEKFEGAFMNRTIFTSPTDRGETVFGLGVVGVSVELAGVVFQKLFYEKKTDKFTADDKPEDVRKAIEIWYDKNIEAFRKKDVAAVMALRADDFHTILPDGTKNARADMQAYTERFLGRIERWISLDFQIGAIDLQNDLASADVTQKTIRMQRLTDEQLHKVESGAVQRETWKKTAEGWKLYRVDNIRDTGLYINDQLVRRPDVMTNSPKTEINQKDLETLLDPIFAERMEKLHIPGAVISIVKGGKIIFAKGYGVADVEKKTPVVADKTLFRIGSITKVFTATAVMQMADEGKIKLTDDVNKYLKGVSVPNTFAQPITFGNLLTHTSGLDEISPGRRTSVESEVVPLGAFLKSRIVRQFAPGEIISYSTYNPALAAHAVEQITQQPFKAYLQKNVFEPLGMNHTSITAVKEEYKNDLATGYEYAENKYAKLPFQWFNTYPASDINSTATDMARFIIANLNYGSIDGKRILSERAAREMQATHFRNHPKIPGWAYGFYETEQNDLRFVEHGGSMDDGYSALLSMIPEKNTGLFIACNTESCASDLSGAIKNAFLNRYFPAPKKTEIPSTKNPSPDALKKFAGKYQSIIYCHSCAPNTSYVPESTEVKISGDGMLIFGGGRWKQIEPLLFILADGDRAGQVLLGFKENAKGEIAFMFNDSYRVYERVSQ